MRHSKVVLERRSGGTMAVLGKFVLQMLAICALIITVYVWLFYDCTVENEIGVPMTNQQWSQPIGLVRPPASCSCPTKSFILKEHLHGDKAEALERRAQEYKEYKQRTRSSLSSLLFAPSNSPLQYPIQGFTVRPLTPALIPGLALHAERRSSYKVSINVSSGVLSLENPAELENVIGNGESFLIFETKSLRDLNDLLARVTYASTIYHVHTGDLAYFQFENHEAVFPIVIQQPSMPVFYDTGKDISSKVTIVTKTFLRYKELNVLLSSIRSFYKDMMVIVADDSFTPENISGEHILHYIMPPAKGWFAGRNLGVSQVTTKYFLWVDDDFLFTEETKIERLVEVMEAMPELDVVGGSVTGNQFFFSLFYEEGDEEGGCLNRKSNRKFQSLPNNPQCFLVSGVVNFFLARTDAVKRVGFDPRLPRVAHSEFFMDGLGDLMVATCGHVSIGHQRKAAGARYSGFRHPGKSDEEFKKQLHFYKNHLKCVNYG